MKLGRLTRVLAALCLFAAALLFLTPGHASAAVLPLSSALTEISPDGLALSLLGALGGTITLAGLREKRSQLFDEMDTITRSELTDETRARFDAIEEEVRGLDADIARLERAEERQRERARSQAPHPTPLPGNVPAAPAASRDLGWEFGAFVRSYAQSQMLFRADQRIVSPVEIAAEAYGEQHPVTLELARAQTRAQTASDNASGGFLVAPAYASEIFRLYGPKTIVRKRARVVPGNATYLRGKSGASVGYVGENEQGKTTGVTFGTIDMTEKDISAVLPISLKLLRNANTVAIEGYCRDEMARAASEFEDLKCLYGTGTGKEVKGYAASIPDTQKFAAVNKAAPTNQEVRADLRKVLKALVLKNVPIAGNDPCWFMNDAVLMYLQDLYQGDLKAFPTLEGPNPMLMGHPVDTSTQITGPAGNGGDIFFGAHKFAMIADSVTMRLSTSDQATIVDANGKPINLWAQGMMAIKLDMSHDFALQDENAFAMLTDVKWGQ
ncbi:phage capsid family protein [Acetobacteraceae bacterium AT-5844]|nr:phage capsid family protein [Acetobacteraceae bacterium AT-5844]